MLIVYFIKNIILLFKNMVVKSAKEYMSECGI